MNKLFLILVFLMPFSHVLAVIEEGGRGVLFGEDHTFAFSAAPGWVLDNQSGIDQGVHMAFYPKSSSWSNSPVVVYGKAVSSTIASNIQKQVDITVNNFRENDSPNYTAIKEKPIKLRSGGVAEVYHFSGDKWGNYEAAAYIQEKDTINFLVFNSRNKADFYEYLPYFQEIVKSYHNLYTPPSEISDQLIRGLKERSEALLKLPGGDEYETKAVKSAGSKMANTLRACTSYLPKGEVPSFTYYAVININGVVERALPTPVNALTNCFSGLMFDSRFPEHDLEEFVLEVNIKIKG